MSAHKRTTAVRWLLPVYLVAVTAAGWFHNHPVKRCVAPADRGVCSAGGCSAAGAMSEEACADHDGDHVSSPRSGEGLPCNDSDHDNCPVCQFLAQKPVPAERVEEVTSTALPEAVPPSRPALVVVEVPRVRHSRAPPSVV